MATIKSFTSLEQSKKLAEILPLESADMYYTSGDEYDICFGSGVYKEIADWICKGTPRPADIPCWSLAALLDILPKINGLKPILDLEENSIQYTGIDLYVVADNPVDACVAMIIKLHERKML